MANRKATFAKRQRETDLKDRAKQKDDRRSQKRVEVREVKGPQIAWDEAVHAVTTDETPAVMAGNEGDPASADSDDHDNSYASSSGASVPARARPVAAPAAPATSGTTAATTAPAVTPAVPAAAPTATPAAPAAAPAKAAAPTKSGATPKPTSASGSSPRRVS
jgi:hypothetical protein